jgi:hypothetical protein
MISLFKRTELEAIDAKNDNKTNCSVSDIRYG